MHIDAERQPTPLLRLFEGEHRARAMRWLNAHASYDDPHPWEALDLVGAIVGDTPHAPQRWTITHAVVKSYDLYRLALDVYLDGAPPRSTLPRPSFTPGLYSPHGTETPVYSRRVVPS